MVTFFIEGLKHLHQVGTVFPSSPWFARAMTQSVRRDRSPKRVLEIRPGTGGMTRLVQTLSGCDQPSCSLGNRRIRTLMQTRRPQHVTRPLPGDSVDGVISMGEIEQHA